MSKHSNSATLHRPDREKPKSGQGIPLIVFLWALGLGLVAYAVSRFVVPQHPLHWASAIAGLLVGAGIGYIWYRTRGDVIPF